MFHTNTTAELAHLEQHATVVVTFHQGRAELEAVNVAGRWAFVLWLDGEPVDVDAHAWLGSGAEN